MRMIEFLLQEFRYNLTTETLRITKELHDQLNLMAIHPMVAETCHVVMVTRGDGQLTEYPRGRAASTTQTFEPLVGR